MSALTTRLAVATDIPRLEALWDEQRVIETQLDPRLALAHPTPESWLTALHAEVHSELDDTRIVVAVRKGAVLGFIRFRVESGAGGRVGRVMDVVVDAHNGSGGVGSVLLDAATAWLHEQGAQAVLFDGVPRNNAVQQAFWDAKGARVIQQIRYLPLRG
ncbi:MAG: GNAT family N-acetyltransferase [Chloroflexota bacterium]